MPEREFQFVLEPTGEEWGRAHFETVRGQVGNFVVQYETSIGGKRVAVTRYDSAHGRPHQDTLDRRGNVVDKRWLDNLTSAQVVKLAIEDIRVNWAQYKQRFLEDRS